MEHISKILIGIYSGAATVSVFVLWQNTANSDSAKNAGILLTSIFPVLLILLQYFKTEVRETQFSYLLLYDMKEKDLTDGGPFGSYGRRYMHMFTNLGELGRELKIKDPHSELMGPLGLNLIEYGIMNSLMQRFYASWDVVVSKSESVTGTTITWGSGPAKKAGTSYSVEDIRTLFAENPFASHPKTLYRENLVIPPDTKLKVTRPSHNLRVIEISSRDLNSRITIAARSGMVLQGGIWGVLVPDDKNQSRYYGYTYEVAVNTQISWRVLDQQYKSQLLRWHDNMADILSEYDWHRIEKEIDRDTNRKATAKVLGIPYGPKFIRDRQR